MSSWPTPDPWSVDRDPGPTSGRHAVLVGHLVMGIAFLGLVAVWAVLELDWVAGTDLGWLLPVPWLAAGAIGLAVVALTARRRRTPQPTYPGRGFDDPTDETTYDPDEDPFDHHTQEQS